jgi:hypothetical protein
MRCPDCGHTLTDPIPAQCPRCREALWTGKELPRLVAKLLHPPGCARCVVCGQDVTDAHADRCPNCSARYRAAV